MFSRLTSVFRRSTDDVEDSIEENVVDPITSKPNVMNDTFVRMNSTEDEDVDLEDGVLSDLIRFPDPCENERRSSGHSSSSIENSGVDTDSEGSCLIQNQSEAIPTSTLWSQINMKSVAVQCDPIEVVSRSVQYEPVLQVSQGVQCEPVLEISQSVQHESVSQVTLGVQCEPVLEISQSVQHEPVSQVTQGVQCEPVLVISQSMQYESQLQSMPSVQCDTLLEIPQAAQYESPLQSSSEKNYCEHTSLSRAPNISACESTDLNSELICKSNHLQNKGDYQQSTSGLYFPLPTLQKELDSVNFVSSSQTSICMSSSNSDRSSVNNEVVSELPEPSRCCDSTRSLSESSVESINRSESCCKTIMKRKDKMKNKGANKRKHLIVKENNEKISTPSSKCKEKCNEDYTAQELIEEVATCDEFSVVNRGSNKSKSNKNEGRKTKKKNRKIHETLPAVDITSSLKMGEDGRSLSEDSIESNNRSELCTKNTTKRKKLMKSKDTNKEKLSTLREENEKVTSPSKPKEKRDEEYTAEELLEEMATGDYLSVNNVESNKSKCNKNENRKTKKISQISIQDKPSSSPVLNVTSRNSTFLEPSEIEHSQSQNVSQWFNSMACERASSPESIGDDTLEELTRSRSYCHRQLHSKLEEKDTRCLDEDNTSNHQLSRDSSKHLDSAKESESLQHVPEKAEQSSRAKRRKVPSGMKKSETSSKSHNNLVPYSESESDSDHSPSTDCVGSSTETEDHNKQQNSSLPKERCVQVPEQKSPAQSVSSANMRRNVGAKCRVELVKHTPTRIRDIWDSEDDDLDCSRASTVTYRTRTSTRSSHWRHPYTQEEREAILWYIIDHKYFKLIKGRAMWERMEKAKICPDRTWQSMKEHFIKKILPNLRDFHLDSVILKRFGVKKF